MERFLSQFERPALVPSGQLDETSPNGYRIAHIGKDSGQDAVDVIASGFAEARPASLSGDMSYKVVCFHTKDDLYRDHAKTLIQSLDRFGIPHDVEAIEPSDDWEAVCSRKSEFILRKWKEADTRIVWLDADATVEGNPHLFATIEADFAIHKLAWGDRRETDGWQFASGTMMFGRNAGVEDLLSAWVLRCKADPSTWDQVHLQSAWCDVVSARPLRTVWLPRSYLSISGLPDEEPPIIRHWQASRKVTKKSGTSGALECSGPGMDDRRRNRLWRSSVEAFWIEQGVDHIAPSVGKSFPEGFDVGQELHRSVDGRYPLLEYGCGIGRIAQLFEPSQYVGADINPHAILAARSRLPEHTFRIADNGLSLPSASCLLMYTVALHMPDDDIEARFAALCAGVTRVVLCEIMDSRWRRDGDPPVFNRDPEHYILIMQRVGFRLVSAEKHEYERYAVEPFNIGRDSRISFLSFDRVV